MLKSVAIATIFFSTGTMKGHGIVLTMLCISTVGRVVQPIDILGRLWAVCSPSLPQSRRVEKTIWVTSSL